MKKIILSAAALLAPVFLFAQQEPAFSRADSLRGTLSPLRSCFDVKFYDLNVDVAPATKSISGFNIMNIQAVESFDKIQIDLFAEMQIDNITSEGQELAFTRDGNAVFISFPQKVEKGALKSLMVSYKGKPREAVNAPWDGGFSWKKDKKGRDWVAVSCEGIGASLWWPNKDHLSDEPDSMRIVVTVPDTLTCVANGNLRSKEDIYVHRSRFEWFVSYPINNYNVTLNIGTYANFKDVYTAGDGEKLDLDYYVLDYNLEAAKKHFEQVKPMLACYEKYFGKYPFWNDGYALVETPYWGMEHQGAIAYGNNYKNLPDYGFDFIIIHESGHEYFGNSLSVRDHGDMWIHESFCTYSEILYLECTKSKEESLRYLKSRLPLIKNGQPMLGPQNVNYGDWNDSDMYYKGAWMLHTLRNVIGDDDLWLKTIKSFCLDFKIKNLDTKEVVDYFSKKTGKDLTGFFDQYLKNALPPVLEYTLASDKKGLTVKYRWANAVPGFSMPLGLDFGKAGKKSIVPTSDWQSVKIKGAKDKKIGLIDGMYYIQTVEK